jgi:hypothetical protein
VSEMTFEQVQHEKDFIQNWLSDLLDAMEAELDQPTLNRLVGACGRGCFLRHAFKREMAVEGKGSLEKLISAMQNNFEVWLAEDGVHIRYGETVERCYCPVAPNRLGHPDELHCQCTRATRQSIFETALGRPVRVGIIETLRRGGETCHCVVKV